MVCTTITVIAPVPTIALIDKGLTVNGLNPSQCAALPGNAIGFYLKLTLVHTSNISARVVIGFTTPTGSKTATYSSLSLSVGTYDYYLGYSGEVYAPGTYTFDTVSVTPA